MSQTSAANELIKAQETLRLIGNAAANFVPTTRHASPASPTQLHGLAIKPVLAMPVELHQDCRPLGGLLLHQAGV
ncbi:hypothetical protein N8E89_21405 (plasmid) [Phyllobacterium sp. A18/5-2]|uniref:hypothetical protein n=1 Tax=Phyllobacterium sp. A18/5-2 TaxID=2978392 RepID=UPI0021C8C295|nr:hypothetical protein [Phyllobacterium sp. A18/5-2]UXN67084.1 hypothetical protein N8E89_21405 [Phyllobacterium sp. A18/5-2]